jgi:hypothetical protein
VRRTEGLGEIVKLFKKWTYDKMVASVEKLAVPKDKRYHVELRTEAYLCEPVFAVPENDGWGSFIPTGPGFHLYQSSYPKPRGGSLIREDMASFA